MMLVRRARVEGRLGLSIGAAELGSAERLEMSVIEVGTIGYDWPQAV